MSAATFALADLRLLLSRTRWPVPGIRWWAIQELAMLLSRPEYSTRVEEALLHDLDGRRLESEAVELLFVFWIASQNGYKPNSLILQHLRAPSPLSDLLLREFGLAASVQSVPTLPTLEAAPGFRSSAEFDAVQGRMVPKIFWSLLDNLENEVGLPFCAQYAFEWERTGSVYPKPIHSDIGYFYGRPVEGMRGQFVTRDSDRGRSAYLRTIAVAESIWRAPPHIVEEHGIFALPLDPTLVFLRSQRPVGLPTLGNVQAINGDSLDAHVRTVVAYFEENYVDSVPLTFSAPLRVTTNEVIDMEIFRWAQWEHRSVDAKTLLERRNSEHGENNSEWCSSHRLNKEMSIPPQKLDQLRDNETDSVPTAGIVSMWRRGYLHADLYARGITLPFSTVEGRSVSARPDAAELLLEIGDEQFGHWGYWNENWTTGHPKQVPAHVGARLIANRSMVQRLWAKPPTRYFYLWRCIRLTRKEVYQEFSVEEFSGAVL